MPDRVSQSLANDFFFLSFLTHVWHNCVVHSHIHSFTSKGTFVTESGAYLSNFLKCDACGTLDALKSSSSLENGANGHSTSNQTEAEKEDDDGWDDVDQEEDDDDNDIDADNVEVFTYHRKSKVPCGFICAGS